MTSLAVSQVSNRATVVCDFTPLEDRHQAAERDVLHFERLLPFVPENQTNARAVIFAGRPGDTDRTTNTLERRAPEILYCVAPKEEWVKSVLADAVQHHLSKEIVVITSRDRLWDIHKMFHAATSGKLRFQEGALRGDFGGHHWQISFEGFSGIEYSLRAMLRAFMGRMVACDELRMRCSCCGEDTLPIVPHMEFAPSGSDEFTLISIHSCWLCNT